MLKKLTLFIAYILTLPAFSNSDNSFFANESYQKSRKTLLENIYSDIETKKTIYCQIPFDNSGSFLFPDWFDPSKVIDRSHRIEIEHVIPAEEFGSYIKQWWSGDPHCLNKDNTLYKGRRCAEKTSRMFRLMQSDMYNLFPSVGSINAIRANHEFSEFPKFFPSLFQNCLIKVADNKIEIPDHAKGIVARVYLYFEQQYPFFKIKPHLKKLFIKWNAQHPVSKDECLRTSKIEKIQRNENIIVKKQCQEKKLWP